MESPEILEGMAIRSHNHRWDFGPIAGRCVMLAQEAYDFGLTICLIGILGGGVLAALFSREIWRWLKGSRITYYLPAGKTEIYRTSFPCRHYNDRKYIDGSAIEVNTGLFRRRSAIYGPAAKNWQIARVSLGNNAQGGFGADWVDLVDRNSLPVERALYLINKYPSLQALMLENGNQRNRIAELENKLSSTKLELQTAKDNLFYANERREEWNAGVNAALRIIERDRQYFRSQAAQNIRKCLETLIEASKDHVESEADEATVLRWESGFHRLVYCKSG